MTVAGKDLVGARAPPLTLAVPPYETSPSFPSGHSLNAVVVVGVLSTSSCRTCTGSGPAPCSSSPARSSPRPSGQPVFLGHHWLTDVVAGWLLGLGWLAVVVTAHRLQLTARRHPGDGAPGRAGARHLRTELLDAASSHLLTTVHSAVQSALHRRQERTMTTNPTSDPAQRARAAEVLAATERARRTARADRQGLAIPLVVLGVLVLG